MNNSRILAIKPGHDGSIAYLSDGELKFSFESEKDNGPRYSEIDIQTFLKAFNACEHPPNIVASSGWSMGSTPTGKPIGAGYLGLEKGLSKLSHIFGHEVHQFSSSHERSHILCAYGLSPFKQGEPCYALVWEGHIGSFYFVDEHVNITRLIDVLIDPGFRYAFLYGLADPTFRMGRGQIRLSDAGKLMAIAAYAGNDPIPDEGYELVDSILDTTRVAEDLCKDNFANSRYHNCGVTSRSFSLVAKLLSNKLYSKYESSIREKITEKYPLLISGGCGLNCDWNTHWIESGLFSQVFIPPCSNDSGAAIGTAVDAMLFYTGQAKLNWSVYSGEYPVDDMKICPGFVEESYDAMRAAKHLSNGNVLGWMRGRYEMGPRALGARSILASPATKKMHAKLNQIKRREEFRPIAPVCLEEDMSKYFSPHASSPYMLEFRNVISDTIPAVTHVDNSARPQSVTATQNYQLHKLLTEFKKITGLSVLCNTSLNFNGYGFLNRLSHLHEFAVQHELNGFIFEDRMFMRL